jgi:hypothetical protein
MPFCKALGRLKKNVDELCQLVRASASKKSFESIETEWRVVETLCKEYSTLNQRWQYGQQTRSNATSNSDISDLDWLNYETASSGSLSLLFTNSTPLTGAQGPIDPFSSTQHLTPTGADSFLQDALIFSLGEEGYQQQP